MAHYLTKVVVFDTSDRCYKYGDFLVRYDTRLVLMILATMVCCCKNQMDELKINEAVNCICLPSLNPYCKSWALIQLGTKL